MGDILLENNEDKWKIFKNLLYSFYFLTMRLQSNNKTRLYKSALECLIAINSIKKYLKKAKAEYAKDWQTEFLSITINTGLSLT